MRSAPTLALSTLLICWLTLLMGRPKLLLSVRNATSVPSVRSTCPPRMRVAPTTPMST